MQNTNECQNTKTIRSRVYTLYLHKLHVMFIKRWAFYYVPTMNWSERQDFKLIWWRHLEYYWLIKYVSIVYSCSSIGRTQGCGSHTRFSLWQLFYNTSSWFMGAIYFPFSVHTESYIHCCYSPNMCFLCSAMQCCNISCC